MFAEALDLVTLSAIVEGGEAPPQPAGWSMIFDSPVISQFTEKWQLWQNGSVALTPSLCAAQSWMLAVSLRTSHFLYRRVADLTVGHIQIDYSFAASSDAARRTFSVLLWERRSCFLKIHRTAFLFNWQARYLPGSQIYITGHRQGAAMATLLRSYFAYASDAPNEKNYTYKTYVCIQPKPGNGPLC